MKTVSRQVTPGGRPRAASAIPLIFLLSGLGSCAVFAQETPPTLRPGPVPQAPPPAPPIEFREAVVAEDLPQPGPGQTLWSIGQPTDEEQLYLEYINRSRANPPAEGTRLANTTDPDVLSAYSFFSVDLGLMQSQFNAIAAVPPLAMHPQLLAAARWHSGDMFTNQYQGHYQTNGTVMDPGARLTAQGYPWSTYGENVFSYAKSPWHGHAGFNVDWGYGTGGMQTPPGHRNSIHNAGFREVGIGVVNGTNGSVGPQLVTQNFATRGGAGPLITGVVYYDFNANGFYDVGEGIGGVTVDVPASSYYAVTADSGGYAVPMANNGNYPITFSASGLSTQKVAAVTSLKNVKVDYVPAYSPPAISGPNPAYVNQTNTYTFTPVGAATAYHWQQATLGAYSAVEGAESLANVTVAISPGYSVQASDTKYAGTYSFHLAHPQATDQFVTLNPVLRLGTNSQLVFYKRLGYAAAGQVARAQISTNNGAAWQDLWSQAGSGGSGESSFSQVSLALSAYGSQNVQFRFVYDYVSGSYFYQTSAGVGLYVDNISISNAEQLINPIINNVSAGTSFGFCPTNSTNYLLRVRAQINSRALNWGPALRVATAAPAPSIQVVSKPTLVGSQVQLDFTVSNYRAGMSLQLWKASSPAGTWVQDTAASLQMLIGNSKFRFTTTTGGASCTIYRVKGIY